MLECVKSICNSSEITMNLVSLVRDLKQIPARDCLLLFGITSQKAVIQRHSGWRTYSSTLVTVEQA